MVTLDDDQLTRYSRHLLLEGFSDSVQGAVLGARVLVVGCGGLGGVCCQYLAATGVGEIHIAEPDTVELSNLQRQILYRETDVGAGKVQLAQKRLTEANHDVRVVPIPDRLSGQALQDAVERVDLVVDASDNFDTRFLLNAACFEQGRTLVYGAATGFMGQLTVFKFADGSGCLECLFDPEKVLEGDCHSLGVWAPLTGIVGSMMAGEVIKCLSGVGFPLTGHMLTIDSRNLHIRRIRRAVDPVCSRCGEGAA